MKHVVHGWLFHTKTQLAIETHIHELRAPFLFPPILTFLRVLSLIELRRRVWDVCCHYFPGSMATAKVR